MTSGYWRFDPPHHPTTLPDGELYVPIGWEPYWSEKSQTWAIRRVRP